MNTSTNNSDAIENLIASEGLLIELVEADHHQKRIIIHLVGDRKIIVPLNHYASLKDVDAAQLLHYEISESKTTIHWPGINAGMELKDLLVDYLKLKLEKELVLSLE